MFSQLVNLSEILSVFQNVSNLKKNMTYENMNKLLTFVSVSFIRYISDA